MNFHGHTIRTSLSPGAPGALDAYPNPRTGYLGVGAELEGVYFLSNMFNFSIRFSIVPDGEWGALKHGNWTGGIGCILKDVSCCFQNIVTVDSLDYMNCMLGG